MRSVVFINLVLALIMLSDVPRTAAQGPDLPVVIALDQPTAELWNSHFPKSKIDVVVRSDDEPYAILNRRALSARHVTHVVFRGDQCSAVSRFFKERFSNQGAQSVDLAGHVTKKTSVRPNMEKGVERDLASPPNLNLGVVTLCLIDESPQHTAKR